MIKHSGTRFLPVLMLMLGAAAMALRITLYTVAVDVKGLLVQGHPLTMALIALSGLALAVLLVAAWNRKNTEDCAGGRVSGLLGAFGNVAAGAGILATVLEETPVSGSYLAETWYYLGLAAPVCLFLAGVAKAFGKKPFFLLHVVVSLFFVMHIVAGYQQWSSDPQMQNYVFSFLGAMALLFFGHYTAAMEAGCGNAWMRMGVGLAALYLCMAELGRSSGPALYLGGILWVLTELWGMGDASVPQGE